MLAMIEVNLLPVEYRPPEKTNFPLVVTIAAGVLVFMGVVVWGLGVNADLAAARSDRDKLTEQATALEAEAKQVRDLKSQVDRAKTRQDTIIQISQTKIMWSLKLQQFSQILGNFNGFWLQRLALAKRGKIGDALTMQMSATGSSLRDVARFRDAIKRDPNFFYHYSDLQSSPVQVVALPEGYNYKEEMDFQLTLPLKSVAPAAKGKGKKRR